MKTIRVFVYLVVFAIAIHILLMTKTDTIVNTDRKYLDDGALFQGIMGSKVDTTKRVIKTIIWYDIYNRGHGLKNKANMIDFSRCEYKECTKLPNHIIKDKENGRQVSEPINADAVIFQGTHLVDIEPPNRKNSDQVFVFAERESWMFLGMDMTFEKHKYENLFNWSMTYRTDSDIPLPYGEIRAKDHSTEWQTSDLQPVQVTQRKKNYNKIYKDKLYDVVWLVSNCASKSLREDYISELQKYITVDIIGGCGKQICPKKNNKNCTGNVEKHYKYILSFENTFHKDYVTEKLFDWFNKDIIQVVYGLANYSAIVPEGTIINSAGFESPEDLARFLKDLGASKNRYITYLKKKDQYLAIGHPEMQQRAYCRLCEMLHTKDTHRRVYPHIGAWWQLNSTEGINPFVSERVALLGEICKRDRNSTDKYVAILKSKQIL